MSEDLKRIPERHEIALEETWDLSGLFPSDKAWGETLAEYEKMAEKLPSFKGTLARSAESLADYMDFSCGHDILGERLYWYAYARRSEDERSDEARAMNDRYDMAKAKSDAACAWAKPEMLAIPDTDIAKFLEHPRLADYRVYIARILRLRPYTLSEEGERLAALYEEGANALSEVQSALIHVDLMNVDLSDMDPPEGGGELKGESPERASRRRLHEKGKAYWDSHKTTLASLIAGKVKLAAIRARVRGYPSARAAALFKDDVSGEIYDRLIATLGENLGAVHRYYGLLKRALGLDELRDYDMDVPLAGSAKRKTSWEEAVGLLTDALRPLGDEYASTLRKGLLGRWVDRCLNQGKCSFQFILESYGRDPLIMSPYGEDRIEDIDVLAHESGHAMHTWYSDRANPFRQKSYSILESEVASAFHEEMLFRQLIKTFGDDREMRLYLLNMRVSGLIRMFHDHTRYAEFDKVVHGLYESGAALTVDALSGEARRLLAKYRGPAFTLDDTSELTEMSYVYSVVPSPSFYMYVYAIGNCAAMALADRVLSGGESERRDYIAFLKSGGSRFPIDALKIAGLDMSRPDPVQAACRVFAGLVDELERLL